MVVNCTSWSLQHHQSLTFVALRSRADCQWHYSCGCTTRSSSSCLSLKFCRSCGAAVCLSLTISSPFPPFQLLPSALATPCAPPRGRSLDSPIKYARNNPTPEKTGIPERHSSSVWAYIDVSFSNFLFYSCFYDTLCCVFWFSKPSSARLAPLCLPGRQGLLQAANGL